VSRLATGIRLRLAELVRQPLTLATAVALPPVVVELYGVAVGSFPQLGSPGTAPETVGRLTGALFAVAFLAGLVGLFQVLSARRGDERAAIAGFPRWATLTTRLVTLSAVAVAGAAVAFLALSARVEVAAPALAFAALLLAALVYGLLGVVVGSLVPRELEGSILLVFVADLDNALSSGLFDVGAGLSVPLFGEVAVTHLVPLSHPHELFAAAVLEGELAAETLLPALAWAGGLLAVAFLAYGRVTGGGWVSWGVSA
jgi:hypothetical protein